MYAYIVAIVCVVSNVTSNIIPALPSAHLPYDCRGIPDCNGVGLPSLHNAILRVLTANQEYGRGIHSLHKLYNQFSKDFANLKDQVNSLEKKFVEDKLTETNEVSDKQNKSVIFSTRPPPDLQIHGHVSPPDPQNLEELFKTKHIWTKEEFNSFQTLFINVSANLRTQMRRSAKTLKRVNTYRKNVKKLTHLVRTLDEKLLNTINKDLFEENSRKQKSINSQLESRITQLEQLLKRPDLLPQKDGPQDNLKHSDSGCPAGFTGYMSSCYHFSNETLNWVDAEKYCQQMHHESHLVAIETKMENEYITQYRLFNNVHWSSDFIWLGGLDISGSGKWTWAGTRSPITYSEWQEGIQYQKQSNNIHNQDCVYTATNHNALWNKWNCFAARLNFVCEIRHQNLLPTNYDNWVEK